ncbi:MAG: universal stress protein [Acidobacteriia bacterium]|nr:universal stress protein [Terriglobia bacterium]
MADKPLHLPAAVPTLDASTPIAMQRIMLATDFDPVSEAALLYSLAIARWYGSKIYLMHVVAPEPFNFLAPDARQRALEDAWRTAQRHMTNLLIAGHLEGVDHQVLVEQGDVWEVLSRRIEELSISLLVIGTHARGRVGKLLLGSVAETIFRQATCPVLMVGPRARHVSERTPDQPILFCTGFSAHSLKAGGYALSLAQHQGSQLLLMHVSKETSVPEQEQQQIAQQAHQRLRSLIPPGTQLAASPETIVEFGVAAERILQAAKQRKAGLIVLGVRQPVGFVRRLKWATAYEVVGESPCPVLTVRMTEPE